MLAKIIDWSGSNRFLVLLATLFIVAWGVFAVLRTPTRCRICPTCR